MDYKIIRLNSANADIISANKKDYTFFLRKPMILKDEYVMQLKELLVDSTYTTSVRVVSAPLIQDMLPKQLHHQVIFYRQYHFQNKFEIYHFCFLANKKLQRL